MTALADLVRAMNCYYSNLIEGHDTHPIDIERALKNDYSADPEKRNLQLEAKAHIAVQQWIDEGGIDGRAFTADGIREIHRRFCDLLPPDLLVSTLESTGETDAGHPRRLPHGRCPGRPPYPDQPRRHPALHEALRRGLHKTRQDRHDPCQRNARITGLSWIHPFLDGNGRVMRLMSYAVLREALDTGGVWSIARGLARNVDEYKQHLAACDMPRRNDLDGRGHLSEEALAAFTAFFLRICIDQVKFMEELVQPDRLRTRILLWAEEEIRLDTLPPKAGNVLEALLYRGELPRADVPDLVGTGPRQAGRIVSALTETRCPHVRINPRPAAPDLPCNTGLPLDAGTVSGESELAIMNKKPAKSDLTPNAINRVTAVVVGIEELPKTRDRRRSESRLRAQRRQPVRRRVDGDVRDRSARPSSLARP